MRQLQEYKNKLSKILPVVGVGVLGSIWWSITDPWWAIFLFVGILGISIYTTMKSAV